MNVHSHIVAACSGDNKAETYIALHTVIDFDGLYDILEMLDVDGSHRAAAMANQETQ